MVTYEEIHLAPISIREWAPPTYVIGQFYRNLDFKAVA